MNSIFIDNHSKYGSNCLTFSGINLNIFNSSFINNTSIWTEEIIQLFESTIMGVTDVSHLYPELGASVFFAGVDLLVDQSYFFGNTGFKGGCIYVTSCILDLKQNVLISETMFKNNRGNVGGAINLSINLKVIDTSIIFCVFQGNNGKSIYNS